MSALPNTILNSEQRISDVILFESNMRQAISAFVAHTKLVAPKTASGNLKRKTKAQREDEFNFRF